MSAPRDRSRLAHHVEVVSADGRTLEVVLLAGPVVPLHSGLGAVVADWVADGWSRSGPGGAGADRALVLVAPAHVDPEWCAAVAAGVRGSPVAVVGYGGIGRGRRAIGLLDDALRDRDVRPVGCSLGINTARVRVTGFDEFDVLARGLLLDALRAA